MLPTLTVNFGVAGCILLAVFFVGLFLWLPGPERRHFLLKAWQLRKALLRTYDQFNLVPGERILIPRSEALVRLSTMRIESASDIIVTNKRILQGVAFDDFFFQSFGKANAWHPDFDMKSIPPSAQSIISRIIGSNVKLSHVDLCAVDATSESLGCVKVFVDTGPASPYFILYHKQANMIAQIFNTHV